MAISRSALVERVTVNHDPERQEANQNARNDDQDGLQSTRPQHTGRWMPDDACCYYHTDRKRRH